MVAHTSRFIMNAKVECHLGMTLVGPFEMRRIATIAHQIAWIQRRWTVFAQPIIDVLCFAELRRHPDSTDDSMNE